MTNMTFAATADDVIFAIGATEIEAASAAERDGVTGYKIRSMSLAVADEIEKNGFDGAHDSYDIDDDDVIVGICRGGRRII